MAKICVVVLVLLAHLAHAIRTSHSEEVLGPGTHDGVGQSIEKASSSPWLSLLAFDLAQRALGGPKKDISVVENKPAAQSKYPEEENWFAVDPNKYKKTDTEEAEENFVAFTAGPFQKAYEALKGASRHVFAGGSKVDDMEKAEENFVAFTSQPLNQAYESLKRNSKATMDAYKASVQGAALTVEEVTELENRFDALTTEALWQATESLKAASKKEYGSYKPEEVESMLESKFVALTEQSFSKAYEALKQAGKSTLDAYESTGWDYADLGEKLAAVTAQRNDLLQASESLGLASKGVLEAYKAFTQAARGSTSKLATLMAEKEVSFEALEEALEAYESLMRSALKSPQSAAK